MRFRVLLSGGTFSEDAATPVSIQVDGDDVGECLHKAMRLVRQEIPSVALLFSEEEHKIACCELEVYQCRR